MNDFERIKTALPLLATITRVTGLVKKGSHLEECPLCASHDCFSVITAKQAWKCHSCGEGGDIFNLIGLYENLDAKGALARAAELAGLELSKKSPPPQKKNRSMTEKIFLSAAGHYHDHMLEFGGREYFIEKRGHTMETLRTLRVGMSTGCLIAHLRSEGFSDQVMIDSGLITQNEKSGSLRDYWPKGLSIWPVIASDGEIITLTMKDPAGKMHHATPAGTKKNWFLNHAALSKFSELIIVEGQNDGAALSDIGMHNWIGTAGQPSQDQVQLLRNFGTKKYFYLWFDQDLAKDVRKNEGGMGHTRKIYKSLSEQEYHVKVLRYPTDAKDPDDLIQGLRKIGSDAKKAIRRLKEEALDPLKWEIELFKRLPTLDERSKALESAGVFREVNCLPDIAQEVYIEAISELGFSEKAVRQKMEREVTLLSEVHNYLVREGRNAKGNELADRVFKWFSSRGRFFRTQDNKVFLLYRHTIYEISDNLPFRTIISKLTKLSIKEAPGKQMYDFLQMLCFDRGELIEVVSWIHTNRETDTIYVNLNGAKSEIIRITPGMPPEAIPNGTNKDGVLLSSSNEIKPFDFQPNTDVAEGMAALSELLFCNLTCEKEMRYFVLCWVCSFLLVDFNKNRALLHCTGSSQSGKSTAASLISQLLFGQDLVGQSSAASAFSEGSQSPLVILDNLENKDYTKQMVTFMLLAANSATKKKRKGGTDSEVVVEKVNALVMLTSIEPIPGSLPELINRTFNVVFDERYKTSGFVGDETSRMLIKKRNLILSALMKLMAGDVLNNLKRRANWLIYIEKEFPQHNKRRANEFITMLMIILEAVLPYIPYYKPGSAGKGESVEVEARDILKKWIIYQDSLADETAVTSNTILNLLDGLAKEVYSEMRVKDLHAESHPDYSDNVFVFRPKEYFIDFIKTCEQEPSLSDRMQEEPDEPNIKVRYFEFVATSAALQLVFSRYCKNNGLRNMIDNASALGSRISNDIKLLKKGGWQIVSSEGKAPYYRIRRGKRFWKFRIRLDQIER